MIIVEDVFKSFKMPQERFNSLKEIFVNLFKKKKHLTLDVLKGISFDVYEGDFVGIVGKNGSGKSTLLKILAGIYFPEKGRTIINERISPFLELGVGFNPELTGRENIFLNGAILGMSKKQILDSYDKIVEFSELEEFMDQKIKNYSSGMQVRLAFSVAIHAKAPIILLDEVLAVGDTSFQRKCNRVFEELKNEGRTIILVTHNMEAVRTYCNRAFLIDGGRIVESGSTERVALAYEKLNIENGFAGLNKHEIGGEKIKIEKVECLQNNKEVISIGKGDNLTLRIYYRNSLNENRKVNFAIGIIKDSIKVFDSNTINEKKSYEITKKSSGYVEVNFTKLQLLDGDYLLHVSIFGDNVGQMYHSIVNATGFTVLSGTHEKGIYFPNYSWADKLKQ